MSYIWLTFANERAPRRVHISNDGDLPHDGPLDHWERVTHTQCGQPVEVRVNDSGISIPAHASWMPPQRGDWYARHPDDYAGICVDCVTTLIKELAA